MRDRTTNTKAELLKMLADAVRNTPGATQIETIPDDQPELKRDKSSAPKRTAKIKSVRRKRRR
jgi:hypothetical protein